MSVQTPDKPCPVCSQMCPVCCDPPDFCEGHGETNDPAGHAIMRKHEAGDHSECRACYGYCTVCETLRAPS